MMSFNHRTEPTTILPGSREQLDEVLNLLDELHTAASEGQVFTYTDLNRAELLSVLREVIFTAQETITEIQSTRQQRMPVLRLVEKKSKAG